MIPRLNNMAVAPEILQSMVALEKAVATKDARADGETKQRLYLLDA